MYREVTVADIEAWEAKYPNSADEKEDLLEYYINWEGDMTNVVEFIPFSEDNDLSRFRNLISAAIDANEVEEYPAFTAFRQKKLAASVDPAQRRTAAAEANRGKGKKKQKKKESEDSFAALALQIRSRQQEAGSSLVDSLMAKYGTGSASSKKKAKSGTKKSAAHEMTDEEFERMQSEMGIKKKAKKR